MRSQGFLRTPIRGDHQSRLQNLMVAEQPLAGDPSVGDPYPQALEITFTVSAGTTEVQIAPLWEGLLSYAPDSVANLPSVPADVTVANYPSWPVIGELVLKTPNLISGASTPEIPLLAAPPALVRYAKVELTADFLFTTLQRLPFPRFIFDGAVVGTNDPLRYQKLVIAFLRGKASVACPIDPADASKDGAMHPMPIVRLAGAGASTLRVTTASLALEALLPTWFYQEPAYDGISGEVLVPPGLTTIDDQLRNPAHPANSVISTWAIFQSASATAYAPDQGPAKALRVNLSAARPDGRTYRRIDVVRPSIPGRDPGASPQRPFPMYQLCWRPVGGGMTESQRLPLSGHVYVPLANDSYRFWAIPRSQNPMGVTSGDQLKLSLKSSAVHYIGTPEMTVDLALGAASTATIYAHLQEYDAKLVWERFRQIRPERDKFKKRANAEWNAGVFDWFIPTTAARAPFGAIYGYIRESAGRHGLAPEFLHAVFFGEGGNQAIAGQIAFDPAEVLDGFGFVGLDLVVYRTGRLPAGFPLHPPEIPAAEAEEIAEYHYNLATSGYLDPTIPLLVMRDREVVRHEAGFTRTLQVGRVMGWNTAIELVAAELHTRLDELLDYCASHAPPIVIDQEVQRRYLAYVRFNARPRTAHDHADNLATRLRKWSGPPPPDNTNARFNALQRIAVAQWYEEAGIYR